VLPRLMRLVGTAQTSVHLVEEPTVDGKNLPVAVKPKGPARYDTVAERDRFEPDMQRLLRCIIGCTMR